MRNRLFSSILVAAACWLARSARPARQSSTPAAVVWDAQTPTTSFQLGSRAGPFRSSWTAQRGNPVDRPASNFHVHAEMGSPAGLSPFRGPSTFPPDGRIGMFKLIL